jgi:hypothetical protein
VKSFKKSLFRALAIGMFATGLSTAKAAIIDVALTGTVTSSTHNYTGQSALVGFSYNTSTVGAGGVFSGGANFLNPYVTIGGGFGTYTFNDHVTPSFVNAASITLVDGSPDTLALKYDMDGYITNANYIESLITNFAGASNFLNGVGTLPSAIRVSGSGTGSFGLTVFNDCLNYVCAPADFIPSVFGAQFSFNQLTIGPTPVAAVPEPATYAMLLAGLGVLGFTARRKSR